jgi:hypothetical protein
VRNAFGESHGFAAAEGETLAVELRRQRAGSDESLFVFEVMNV